MEENTTGEECGWMKELTRRRWTARATQIPSLLWRMGFGPLIGKSLMIIAQTGRVSGLPRHTVTQYHRLGGTIYAPAALGSKANWYRNLVADPIATLQLDGAPFSARARRVTDDEELRLYYEHLGAQYPHMTEAFLEELGIDPTDMDDLLAHKDRLYVVAFEPCETPGPPPLPANLRWVPPLLVALNLIIGIALIRRKNRKG